RIIRKASIRSRTSSNHSLYLGFEYSLRIELPYGERYADAIQKGTEFRLQAGGEVIARGEVTDVLS
ncbi:MAG: hypothetical protein P1V97_29090, partial [Planctomycetota bacterium]|nr:hypothetical protein [Planctomycetota bacterium]